MVIATEMNTEIVNMATSTSYICLKACGGVVLVTKDHDERPCRGDRLALTRLAG